MKIVETTFERLPRERLEIGFEGENQRATVRIDCTSVFAEYPNATPTLIVKPLFADAYPVVVDRNGTDVDWLITSEILSFSGDGEIQLVFYKDQVICKSAVSKIRVSRSLTVTGDMPDPVVQWIENANRKLAEVDAQIVELEGMVDTATDAATRAEQSASTASTKAEQAAGSAATATEKATEATNAAGTATAKAAEAQTAAQTATEKANAAAESERIATAKAGDATTAAGTATAKAEQATEAAQTATEKAGDASASATAAQASATNAASSATAASASETAAKASETAAGASATQAAQSAQTANTAAQTATQKAAEASQSATNAAASATNAATSAETASTKAGEAAQSAQAVAETAEQLADSLEQIDQNTQDIAELDERKANIDGYYPDMTVGNAEQLNSSKYVENSEPYTFRTSGGTSDIGNREYLDAVVGGTVAWNQAVRDEASENSTDFADVVTVTDAVEDAAGVKVKIEPVQDLHGYDHPWPAGGGKNKLEVTATTQTINGVTFTVNDDGTVLVNGTATAVCAFTVGNASFLTGTESETYILNGCPANGSSSTYNIDVAGADGYDSGNGILLRYNSTISNTVVRIRITGGVTISNLVFKPMIRLATETDATFAPYENICPITGWDGAKVTRTGKNLLDESNLLLANGWTVTDGVYSGVNTALHIAFSNGFPGMAFKPDTTYTVSLVFRSTTASKITVIGFNYTDGTHSTMYMQDTVEHTVSFTSTSGKSVSNLLLSYGAGDKVYISQMQVEEGSAATDYEPYAGNTYDITLPTEAGTVYGGELTVNADGSGSLVVDRASVDLGTLGWMFMNVNGTQRLCSVSLNPLPLTPKSDYYFPEIICSAYKVERVSQLPNEPYCVSMGFSGYGYGNRLIVNDEAITTVEQATEKLSGQTCVYKLLTPITYTLTPTEIRTLLGTNNVWADTGDLALTYTGTDEHLTLESGKKYLSRISGTDSMLLGSGQEITAVKGTDNVFDLTQMFGTAVADYVYGQGAAFFRKWFPNAVYPYNAGELKHVEGLQSHDMVGFNAFDKDTMVVDGCYIDTDGTVHENVNYKSTDFIPAVGGMSYYINTEQTQGGWGAWYDGNKNYAGPIAYFVGTPLQTAPQNACYMRLTIATSTSGNPDTLCINLSHSGARNGEYEPYEKHSYPLDSTVILRGIPKVDSNGVYWDGDRYLPDGTVERRYGVVDLGTQVWGNNTFNGISYFVTNNIIPDLKKPVDSNDDNNFLCTKYPLVKTPGVSTAFVDKTFFVFTSGYIYVRDSSFADLASFRVAMQGVLLVYELATPTTETAQPYHSTQWVSDWGTEEFVSTGIVPVGHETRYPANLRDKLQHLPDAASGNGSYLITQTDGQMVLTPFPAPPSTAGNYVLKATVVNGVATYTWEVAT